MTKGDLIQFEQEIAGLYEQGLIKAPVHLSSGNELQLIDIFKRVNLQDWVLSSWRNHYHALLRGIPPEELKRQILAGRSMFINDPERRFYASSIVGGTLPIAVGLAMGIKRKIAALRAVAEPIGPLHAAWDEIADLESRHVWAFVGDMTALTGGFNEAMRYAYNWQLPVTFVCEDNGKSVLTQTRSVWQPHDRLNWDITRNFLPNVIYYQYELKWPHHGTGKWISFF